MKTSQSVLSYKQSYVNINGAPAMPRMHIFNALEEESFEAPPVFTSVERKKFFDFPLTILDTTESLRTPTNKACFLMMAGYFKSRRRFFAKRFHTNDIAYIIGKLGISIDQVEVASYDKQSYARHQRLILDFYGFVEFDKDSAKLIADEINRMVRSCVRPKLILLEVLQ